MICSFEKQGILKYYGHIDNVPEVMANSHIIVHPSYHEGLSNVCLEAAACGRPVLTTDVPGCRETIIPDSGILFSARSSDALISALETILSLAVRLLFKSVNLYKPIAEQAGLIYNRNTKPQRYAAHQGGTHHEKESACCPVGRPFVCD